MTARRGDSSGRCLRGPVLDQCPRRGSKSGRIMPPAVSWVTTVAVPVFAPAVTLPRCLGPSTAHRLFSVAPHRHYFPAVRKSHPAAAYRWPAAPLSKLSSPPHVHPCRKVFAAATNRSLSSQDATAFLVLIGVTFALSGAEAPHSRGHTSTSMATARARPPCLHATLP